VNIRLHLSLPFSLSHLTSVGASPYFDDISILSIRATVSFIMLEALLDCPTTAPFTPLGNRGSSVPAQMLIHLRNKFYPGRALGVQSICCPALDFLTSDITLMSTTQVYATNPSWHLSAICLIPRPILFTFYEPC